MHESGAVQAFPPSCRRGNISESTFIRLPKIVRQTYATARHSF
jgi:hypothetical protein